MTQIAVCGLAPGAGTTLLSRLIARPGLPEVVDCGLLQTADAPAALARASHVVWTVPADPRAVGAARALLLESDLAPPPGEAVELLAAVETGRVQSTAPDLRVLRQVVAERCERLVLVPHVRALAGADAGAGATVRLPSHLSAAIAAIAAVLRIPINQETT